MTHPFNRECIEAAALSLFNKELKLRYFGPVERMPDSANSEMARSCREDAQTALQAAWDAAVKGGRVRHGEATVFDGSWTASDTRIQNEPKFPVAIIKMDGLK